MTKTNNESSQIHIKDLNPKAAEALKGLKKLGVDGKSLSTKSVVERCLVGVYEEMKAGKAHFVNRVTVKWPE